MSEGIHAVCHRCRKNAVVVFRGGAGLRFYSQGKPNTVDPGAEFILEHINCSVPRRHTEPFVRALVFASEDEVPSGYTEVINIVGDVVGDLSAT